MVTPTSEWYDPKSPALEIPALSDLLNLLWATDVHLDHVPFPSAALEFGRALRQEQPTSQGLIVSGDIGEANTVAHILETLVLGYAGPVYFVLGNHDYYGGSFQAVDERIAELCRQVENLHWLQQTPTATSDDTILLGVNGWYDARYGDRSTDLQLNDFRRITELFAAQDESRESLLKTCAQRADSDASALDAQLLNCYRPLSCKQSPRPQHIIVVMHVPPFQQAAWHDGKPSDNRWAPFFSSKALGDVLLAHAGSQPHRQFTVLCGHTHGCGVYRPLPNLLVYTGKARYGAPELAGILTSDASQVSVMLHEY